MFHQPAPNAADVGDLRIGANPNPVIDHAADVFRKVAIKTGLDRADRFVQQNVDGHLRRSLSSNRGYWTDPPEITSAQIEADRAACCSARRRVIVVFDFIDVDSERQLSLSLRDSAFVAL